MRPIKPIAPFGTKERYAAWRWLQEQRPRPPCKTTGCDGRVYTTWDGRGLCDKCRLARLKREVKGYEQL
jgi:hypothetical protein